MDFPPATAVKPSPTDDPAAQLARTIRDEQVQTVDWWASTPAEGYEGAPPPRLGAENFGELLRRQGLNPGAEVGGSRYQIEKVLGQGSGGTVWGVTDRRLQRTVAIKVLNRGGNRDGFIQEARIAASLQHPNIQPVYDLDLTGDGDSCFVMKRIAGTSLGEAMREVEEGTRDQALSSIATLVNVFIGVCQALAFAHHHGIIHQDVKPDNIMLGEFGEVLLVDWGCAVHGSARAGSLYGTPLYMSPEQARREFADARSDVYCLGATFFHALLGRAPTPPKVDAEAFWARKRRGDVDAPTKEERQRAPPELIAIALKAIAADPVQRYASVEAMLADLRSYQSGLSVSAWREPLWRFMRRWYQQHRAQCWTAVVALLLVGAAGGLWWREKLRERSAWQLILHEDFRDVQRVSQRFRALLLGSDWAKTETREVAIGEDVGVVVRDGRLEAGRQDQVVDVALRSQIFGNIRAEWTCTPLWNNLNLNCFIGDDRTSAYTFHIGGWGDPSYVALTKGEGHEMSVRATAHLDPPLVQGQSYRFRLEREGGMLRLFLDDRMLIEHDDPSDARVVAPQALGFDAWIGSRNAISDVRIWTRPLPERISPLDVGQQLVESDNLPAALRQYRGIADAYAGQELGIQAAFMAGLTAIRSDEVARGASELRHLVATYPRHALAAHGWYALANEALTRGDHPACSVAREALTGFPGHPLQQRVLFEIGMERAEQLSPRSEKYVMQGPDGRQRVVSLVEAVIAELNVWSSRYGRVVEANSFLRSATHAMIAVGRADLVIAHWPTRGRARGDALIEMGRYDEVRAHWRHLDDVMWQVALRTGTIQEATDTTSRWKPEVALQLTKDVDGLRRLQPFSYVTADALIEAGRAVEVADDPGFPASARAHALFVLGRMAESAEVETAAKLQVCPWTLVALGRIDQALRECATEPTLLPLLILRHLRQSDAAEAAALCAKLEAECPLFYGNWANMIVIAVLPLLVRHDQGQVVEAQLVALLDDVRFTDGLRSWHLLAYALGRIDDATFLAQPDRRELEQLLWFAKALRAEFTGTAAQTVVAWRAWQASQPPNFGLYVVAELVHWRIEMLAQKSASPPDQPPQR